MGSPYVPQADLQVVGSSDLPSQPPQKLGLKLCATTPKYRPTDFWVRGLVGLGFELRTLCLQSRHFIA
jgi:hypothetical protein